MHQVASRWVGFWLNMCGYISHESTNSDPPVLPFGGFRVRGPGATATKVLPSSPVPPIRIVKFAAAMSGFSKIRNVFL